MYITIKSYLFHYIVRIRDNGRLGCNKSWKTLLLHNKMHFTNNSLKASKINNKHNLYSLRRTSIRLKMNDLIKVFFKLAINQSISPIIRKKSLSWELHQCARCTLRFKKCSKNSKTEYSAEARNPTMFLNYSTRTKMVYTIKNKYSYKLNKITLLNLL